MPINWLFISSISLSLTTLFLIIVLLRFGKNKIHTLWTLFTFSIFVWAFGATLISKTTSTQFSNIFWRIACIGVTFTSVFPLHMAYLITNKIPKILVNLIYFLAILYSFLIIKTDLIIGYPTVKYQDQFLFLGTAPLYVVWFLTWFICICYFHTKLIRFYLSEQNNMQIDLKYLIPALAFGFIFGSINFLVIFKWPIFQSGNFGIIFYCLIATYAIFKHQIMGIEVVFKKSLFYSIFIGSLSGIYLLLIMIIELLFRGIVGYKSLIMSFGSAFIIALLFNPLRNRIQTILDKIFLGKTSQEIAHENELLHQQIERSERLKTAGTLALGLAHEVKNPLTTIKTFAEYLPEKYKDDEFVKKFSKIIPSEVERINSIIKQLLDFSKPSPPSFIQTNISQLIKDTLEFLNSEFLKRKVKIDAIDNAHSQILTIDPNQIKQALFNIIFNAMEAMHNGGVLNIATNLIKDDRIEITISDSGCGIPKEYQKRIFDPFFTTKDSGTGLGLSIAHQIMKNHGGSIEVECLRGKGTTFLIKIPIKNDCRD